MSDVSIGGNRHELKQAAAMYQEAPVSEVADAERQFLSHMEDAREHYGKFIAAMGLGAKVLDEAASASSRAADITDQVRGMVCQLLEGTNNLNRINVCTEADITARKADTGAREISAINSDLNDVTGSSNGVAEELLTIQAEATQAFGIMTSLPENFERVDNAIDQT